MDPQFCSQCGAKVAGGDVFCLACGNGLRTDEYRAPNHSAERRGSWIPWTLGGVALVLGSVAFIASRFESPPAQTEPLEIPAPVVATVAQSSTTTADTLVVAQSLTDAQLAERFGDAVYRVEVSGCGFVGSGSGFAIDDHHIVTNQHVVDSDVEPTVVHRDGSRLQGQVIGWQIDPDIAVIKVSNLLPTSLSWAATSALSVGDRVVGLGYPVPETDFSAIPGTIISFDDYQGVKRAIRTDASWDYGNSGGPALTLTGQVAGVVTQFADTDGRQDVPLAFTTAVLQDPIENIIATPVNVTSSCVGSGETQYEPGYIEGLDDYYPDPYNPFWTAILMSVDYLTEDTNKAFDRAYEVLGLGLPVGLLISDDFPSLRPGYFVVYSGRFGTSDEAEQWCSTIGPLVGSCYHRNVGWDSSYR